MSVSREGYAHVSEELTQMWRDTTKIIIENFSMSNYELAELLGYSEYTVRQLRYGGQITLTKVQFLATLPIYDALFERTWDTEVDKFNTAYEAVEKLKTEYFGILFERNL